MKRICIKLTFLLVLGASIAAMAGTDQKKPADAAADAPIPAPVSNDQYQIGKDDILSISVWREPELTRLVAVRSDGKISLPLVGEMDAAGKTPLALQNDLAKLLDQYMKSPVVSVAVQDARSQRFSIIGEVMRPGFYPLVKPLTVLDALALAGGFREFAKTEKMFVLRIGPDGVRHKIAVSYKKILSAKGATQNVELEYRDTLVVP
ncbi:MAG: polysaccharide biosynthesis/export family protein [Acidobacteriota bacterium]|nr:polysaccharide biosynthesis/export family protein [Acidobacteriota bacterium]